MDVEIHCNEKLLKACERMTAVGAQEPGGPVPDRAQEPGGPVPDLPRGPRAGAGRRRPCVSPITPASSTTN